MKPSCPFLLKGCKHKVTKPYFQKLCNSKAYFNCFHYAREINNLKIPVEWLQKAATESAEILPK